MRAETGRSRRESECAKKGRTQRAKVGKLRPNGFRGSMEPPIAPIWEPILRERGCEIIEDDGKQILRDIFEYYFWRVKKLRGVRAGARGIFLVKRLNQRASASRRKADFPLRVKTAALRSSPAADGISAPAAAQIPPVRRNPQDNMRKNSPLKKFSRAKTPRKIPTRGFCAGILPARPKRPKTTRPPRPAQNRRSRISPKCFLKSGSGKFRRRNTTPSCRPRRAKARE